MPAEAELKLRPGALVLFVKNDAQDRWVDGTFGRVVTLTRDVIEVEVASNGFKVALSRCPTLAGITLATKIWPNDVLKVSSHVREFMDSVAKAALLPGSEGRILAGERNMTEGKT